MSEALTIEDYEAAFADHRRLVREIDVIMNGEDGAAKQASLCDLVPEIQGLVDLRVYVRHLEVALRHATECCSAFQSGGQFAHLSRLGEPIFDAIPRLVARLSN